MAQTPTDTITEKADFYIATNGSDSWSGTLPRPNRQKTDGPFATFGRAQRAIREARSRSMHPSVVAIRGGFYPLAAPIALSAMDSGTEGNPILYTAYGKERPVFSGGLKISGWRKTATGSWQTQLPEVVQGEWQFSQLYVNGERRFRPRLPKSGYFEIAGDVPPTAEVNNAGDNRFRFYPGDIHADWYDPGSIEILPFQIWTMSRFPLAAVDAGERIVTVSGHTPGRASYLTMQKGRRYLVENVREALSEPGEWYLDRRSGVLTYLPKPGESLEKTEVIAPRLEKLLIVEGARSITIRGIAFEHTGWNIPAQGHSFPQAEIDISATIDLRDVEDIRLERCRVRHTGNWAVSLTGSSRDCAVFSCELSDLGAGGIKIGGEGYNENEFLLTRQNLISRNRIAHGGRIHPAATGIWLGHSPYNKILQNEIADFYYTAISPGWSWGYGPSGAHHNEIAYNHLHHIGQGVLSDMGGIYTLGVAPGTVLHHNKIHDIDSFDYGGWGIYFDEGSTGVIAENNLVYRTKSAPFHQHYGKENIVRNNILAFGREAQLMRTRAEDHLSFTLTQNIILWSEGPLLGSNWSGNQFKLERNLYWHQGKPVTFADGLDLKQWQAKGFDQGSQIADPQFVATQKDDFRFRSDAAARAIGFIPLDLSQVGPGPDTLKFFGGDAEVKVIKPPAFPLSVRAPKTARPLKEDFENFVAGAKPGGVGFTVVEESSTPAATIRITEETANSGKRSVKFTDAPGQTASYNPHLFYQPNLKKGIATAKFAIRFEPGVRFFHEWRDDASPYRVGPSLTIGADGALTANGKRLTTLPASRWVEIEIVCGLGAAASGMYDLTLRLPGRTPPEIFRNLPCGNGKDFTQLDWWGFVSDATEASVFYLDDLELSAR